MKIIKPPKLNIGDTIGIVASSLPVLPSHQEQFNRGKKLVEEMGFKLKMGKTIGQKKWWMAGAPKEVAADINAMFADPEVKAVIAHTGGYSAISVIEYLDYELITHNPKPFMGMSDMTAYHLAIFTKTGLVGFHMDDVTFGMGLNWNKEKKWRRFGKEAFIKFLTKTEAPGIIKPLSKWEEWKQGEAQGYLIGGILQHQRLLSGTEYFPKREDFKGAILFWEEVGESLPMIAESLYKLKYMGVFDQIAGMLIGQVKYIKPMREKEIVEPTLKEVVLDILKDYKFPIMANLDFGHYIVNVPMPIGLKVSFDTSKKELNFLESAVV